ncbi:hypothetical protein MG290_04495 [Flavobacterium sp. CBA20B-1]|uniref:hypothetical protein n=1 Tax=unclassified Flavobacterium TaxID=196869 RepID=UPI0022251BA3|nr:MULTISPECIES: hypothetical protein [unclassified Flavobacterium]WCM42943.1 hypothetical protein MG290_04495 [Flavobacterium sp. CBA20B-1]
MKHTLQADLDKILNLLITDFTKQFSILEITETVLKERYIKHNEIEQQMVYSLNTEYVESLLKFLSNEGLVYVNVNKLYCITAKGFVKFKTETFQQEIDNKRLNIILQRSAWICSIVAVVISAIAFTTTMLFRSNKSSNYIYKIETISIPQKGN